jgi:glyoxylase-like metal-dependent hydrolase (beta-lactamase superfamily II)
VQIGAVSARPVLEIDCLEFPYTMFFDVQDSAAMAREEGWSRPEYYDRATQSLRLSTHSWLLDTGRHRILVDPCVGNHKPRRVFAAYDMLDTPWLERLRAAGAEPEQIDYVFCTHLHVDHCGWNTRLVDGRWVPSFPNARYLFSRRDEAFWKAHDTLESIEGQTAVEVNVGVHADSVQPVIDAGLAQMLGEEPHTVGDCLTIEPGYGHTPGHLIATLRSQGAGALFAGDALHHPVQIYHPNWNTSGCFLPEEARRTRRGILERCADEQLWLAAAHFMAPHMLRVARAGASFCIASES